jgi:plastocyanin
MSCSGDQRTRRELLQAAGTAAVVTGGAATAAAQNGETHTVDMTDQLVFDPETIQIAPGDTVVWENVGTIGHSVTAYEDEIPADAAYFASGDFETESAARNGYPSQGDIGGDGSYEHTFEVEGSYGYFCIPHEGVGMVGEVIVGGDGGGDGGDEDAGPVPLPGIGTDLGVLLTFVGLATLGLVYLFMKYGGDYGFGDDEGAGR